MKRPGSVLLVGILALSASTGNRTRSDQQDLEHEIPRVMMQAHVPGLQVAVIRGGQIAWHGSFGVKNAASREPVTDETIFEAASLTKPLFAYYVMRLVDQGFIDLDKPLVGYVPRELVEEDLGHPLDRAGFRRDWFERITARHVLSHSSGMPHGERDSVYPLFFEPGTRWKYSAEGYYLLQRAVETLKGDRLENLMQDEVLDPLGMTRSRMVWRDDYEASMANGHSFFDVPADVRRRTEAHAGASLYTTAEDYARFVGAVLNGTGLRPETRVEMLTSRIDKNTELGLGWSLGFGTQEDENGQAIWQWGDYGIFRNYVIAYPGEKTGVVYLTNSHNGLSICSYMVEHTIGGHATGCRDLNYRPFDGLVYQLAWALKDGGPAAIARLPELQAGSPGELSNADVSYLDYVLQNDSLTAEAVAVLQYDVARRPGSGAARLALAKAHIGTGTLDSARAQLAEARKAVEDTVDAGVVDWNLDYVRAMTDAFPVRETDLQRLIGDYGPRHFRIQDGALHYLRDSGRYADYRELVPLSRDTFFIRGLSSFRMTFEFDGNGNAVKVVGTYEGGGRDESARSR